MVDLDEIFQQTSPEVIEIMELLEFEWTKMMDKFVAVIGPEINLELMDQNGQAYDLENPTIKAKEAEIKRNLTMAFVLGWYASTGAITLPQAYGIMRPMGEHVEFGLRACVAYTNHKLKTRN